MKKWFTPRIIALVLLLAIDIYFQVFGNPVTQAIFGVYNIVGALAYLVGCVVQNKWIWFKK